MGIRALAKHLTMGNSSWMGKFLRSSSLTVGGGFGVSEVMLGDKLGDKRAIFWKFSLVTWALESSSGLVGTGCFMSEVIVAGGEYGCVCVSRMGNIVAKYKVKAGEN